MGDFADGIDADVPNELVHDNQESGDAAYRRAKEMCRFLKSLPEAKNIPICVIVDYGKCYDIDGYDPM